MSLLSHLFGRKSSRSTPERLLEAILAFIQADTWNESRHVLNAHPELLTDEADVLLTQLAQTQENDRARQLVEEHRALLRRCREVGIDAVFIALSRGAGEGEGLSFDLQPILTELAQPARLSDMPRRVELYRQALALVGRMSDPPLWAALQVELGNSLVKNPLGERAGNLELAIAAYRQALEIRTRQAMPIEWAQTVNSLANAYYSRIRGDRADNLEQAIAAYHQVLKVATRQAMPLEWAQTMNNLAITYSARVRGDRADNLEQAIATYRQSLQVMTRQATPVDWAQAMMNLANAYYSRICGDWADNLEQAIVTYRQALEVATRQTMPVEWARAMMNLANAYSDRIRGDRADNLELAIACYQQALEVRTRQAMPVEWAQTMNNLAVTYSGRIRGDRADNLEQAIATYRQALEVATRQAMPLDWAQAMMNLANAYSDRIRGDRADNLEQAIAAYQQALEVRTRQAMPVEWAQAMMNLAITYSARIRGDRADNLEQAIAAYRQALQVYTRQAMPVEWAQTVNNLATAYKNRIRGDRADNLEQAIQHYQQALEVYTRDALPDAHRRAQRNLGGLCFAETRWAEAATAYEGALAAGVLLYQAAATPESRQTELRETRDLAARLAYALVKAAPASDALQEAVVILERHRARWLSEALALQSGQPDTVPDDVWQAFVVRREAVQQLQAEAYLPEGTPGRRDFLPLTEALRAARTALDTAIAEMRHHVSDFMPDPAFAQIQAAAGKEATALVYLAATPAGGLALVVSGQSPAGSEPAGDCQGSAIIPLWLNGLTEDALRERAREWFDTYGAYKHASGAYTRAEQESGKQRLPPEERAAGLRPFEEALSAARAAWLATLDDTAHWLWDAGVGQLVAALHGFGVERAALVPQGWLSLLPLHAAWTDSLPCKMGEDWGEGRRYALDDVCFTYAPNAHALRDARRTAARVAPDSLLAVDEPWPVSANPLPNSTQEVAAACAHFTPDRRKVLGGAAATEEAVREQLRRYAVLHFSCHGMAGFTRPLEGGLLMAHDERLTLGELLALRLENARLAVLSACETGVPGLELPDEVISLPAGLAQAGVAGIVASLWSVSDLSTMLLMTRFYELWQAERLDPAEALRQAQRWLRDTTNSQKVAFLNRLPQVDREQQLALLSRAEENDFGHPFHWAAFSYTGV